MGAHVDPDELNAFTHQLENYIQNVNDDTVALKRAFGNVSDSWNDEKQAEFAEFLEELERAIQNFTERAEDEVPRLRRMEEHIREYQQS